MDFLQLKDAHFRINGGGLELHVSEQLLDVANVGAAFQQVGRAGVAEEMATARPADAGFAHGGGRPRRARSSHWWS